MSDGDVIKFGATSRARENPFIVTRFDLQHEITVTEPNNYNLTADDPDIGLRDDDDDGVPNLAYVTGTGAFDHIQLALDPTNPDIVDVTVAAYSDATFDGNGNLTFDQGDLIQQETYEIDLTADTEGEILIDSSLSRDLIEIDANIAASFRIRGMLGDDQVMLLGNGESAIRSFSFDGEGGDDTFTIDLQGGDALPVAGHDFRFDGGDGINDATVTEENGTDRTAYFVNVDDDIIHNQVVVLDEDAVDFNLSDGIVDALEDDDDGDHLFTLGQQITLRAAVQEANAAGDPTYVFLPSGTYELDITGGGTDSQGDLDITGDLTIIGTGAGEAIIDAGGSNVLGDRIFDVANGGLLDLSHVTLTGGFADGAGESGGAIRVRGNPGTGQGELTASHIAIVKNEAGQQNAGGIYVERRGIATILNSVITDNNAGMMFTGGVFLSSAGSGTAGEVLIGNTIIAENTADEMTGVDVLAQSGREFTSLGNNLLTTTHVNFSALVSDYLPRDDSGDPDPSGQLDVDLIVTGVADTFDSTNDDTVRSLRDAVAEADDLTGTPTIWLPGWTFLLTRQRQTATEFLVGEGDIDIFEPMTIRGVGPGLTEINGAGFGDTPSRVFDLVSQSTLDVSHLTIHSGNSTGTAVSNEHGGGIMVRNGSTLNLSNAAVVNNMTTDPDDSLTLSGGGIYFQNTAAGSITRSVITNNSADQAGGGVFIQASGSGPYGTVEIGNTVIAGNTANIGAQFNLLSQNPALRNFTTLGGNLLQIENTSSAYGFVDGQDGDHFGVPEYVVTTIEDTFEDTNNVSLSLRDAVAEANTDNGTIWVPGWLLRLTLQEGAESAATGDLDIAGDVTIVGVGPGLTVIDASALDAQNNTARLFEVNGSGRSLDLSRVTLTGGDVGTSGTGGAIFVSNGELALTNAALVGNSAKTGGAIRVQGTSAQATILRSVFVDNSTTMGGAAIYHGDDDSTVQIGQSIFAGNQGVSLLHREDGTQNLGNNITDDAGPNNFFNAGAGDHIGTVHYVVTSVGDTFDHRDNAYSLSLREAVDLANENDGVAEEIWLPAWDFALTRMNPGSDDTSDVAFGDLDITDSLTVRGIDNQTSIAWLSSLPSDDIFELIGDYNGDGTTGDVDSADFTVWQDTFGSTTDLRADGNDDGKIDNDDRDVWFEHFGNSFDLLNVAV